MARALYRFQKVTFCLRARKQKTIAMNLSNPTVKIVNKRWSYTERFKIHVFRSKPQKMLILPFSFKRYNKKHMFLILISENVI